MNTEIHIDGQNISFPFELKDIFRDTFKSAKWNAKTRQWRVAKGAEGRLLDWVEQVKASGILEEMKAQETARLSEENVQHLQNALQHLKAQITVEKTATEKAIKARKQAEDLKNEINRFEKQFDDIKKARVAAELKAANAKKDIMEVLSTVADVNEIDNLRRGMKSDWRLLKAVNRERFDIKQARLEEIRIELETAGIQSRALDLATEVNFNRRDRDAPDLSLELVFNRIPDVETVPEEDKSASNPEPS